MYLSKLDTDKKKLFLDLSIHAALSDNDFEEEQKAIIDAYCIEMGLEQGSYKATRDLDIVLEELKTKCSKTEINIIIIEIIALIMSDSLLHTMEKEFLLKLQRTLEISEEKVGKAFFAVDHLKDSYRMLNEIIAE